MVERNMEVNVCDQAASEKTEVHVNICRLWACLFYPWFQTPTQGWHGQDTYLIIVSLSLCWANMKISELFCISCLRLANNSLDNAEESKSFADT